MSVTVSGVVMKLTDKAVLFAVNDGEQLWIPLSVVEDGGEDLEEGQDADIAVRSWFAKQEGLD